MHDPIGLGAFRCFAHIKNEGFLDPNFTSFGGDDLVGSSGFPVAGASNSIGSRSIRVLPVTWAKKVPFFLPKYCLTCTKSINNIKQSETTLSFFLNDRHNKSLGKKKKRNSYSEDPMGQTCKGQSLL